MRTSGILMPIFSLPSPYGVGTLGKEAYRFVDFLEKAGQTYWQILPINPTNYGDSPYQSFSSFAGNPYFIDPEMLIEEGLLQPDEVETFDFGEDPLQIDYNKLYNHRTPMLRLAYSRFAPDKEYKKFCKKNGWWLEEFALFMALKGTHEDKSWATWEEPLRFRKKEALEKAREELAEEMEFFFFVQYKFMQQWMRLKTYANERGIKIIGDIPIYVAYDSADTWANAGQFLLDKELQPIRVAGCPPDAFAAEGQLWGNPLYHWEVMGKGRNPYKWWKRRLGHALQIYDWIRIDHFRGFESFYAIPYGDKNAVNGIWMKGPGMDLFQALKKEFGEDLPIIAEDLGFLTPAVRQLLKESGFPGMKVLQFAFDATGKSDYLPHNMNTNCVVYTGTHDNDTIMGWTETAAEEEVEMARSYLHVNDSEGFNWAMMRAAMMSVGDTVILMMQDLIGLGSEARINTPSTLGENWKWRIDGVCINDWLAEIVREITGVYGRLSERAAAEEARKAEEKAAEKETKRKTAECEKDEVRTECCFSAEEV